MESQHIRLTAAIGKWLSKLDQVPGWREWKSEVSAKTFWFDDKFFESEKTGSGNFVLPVGVDSEHEGEEQPPALCRTVAA